MVIIISTRATASANHAFGPIFVRRIPFLCGMYIKIVVVVNVSLVFFFFPPLARGGGWGKWNKKEREEAKHKIMGNMKTSSLYVCLSLCFSLSAHLEVMNT